MAVKVRAAYSGGPLASAHLNTDINTDMAKSTSHLTVSCHVFRQGTISTVDLNLEDIMLTAKQFSIGVSGDTAFPYAVLLQDYNSLKNPNDQFIYIEIQHQQDVLEDLAKKRFEFLALRDDFKYILKHSDDFQNADGTSVDRDKLSKDFDSVVDAINTMQREASACTRDAKQCEFTKFDVAKFNVPVLKNLPKPVGVPNGDDMQPGEMLNTGQAVSSANGQYTFQSQGDGNLVLVRNRDGQPLWASNTDGRPNGVCIMQGDGNLVIYDPNGIPIWSSNTSQHPGSRLLVQNDGNVVIYRPDGTSVWATNTVQ